MPESEQRLPDWVTFPKLTRAFENSILVDHPLDEVFPFFADAGNLEALTPPWLKFSILTEQPIKMEEGTLIDYQIRLHGIPMRWRTRIDLWEPPYRFVDSQIKGPYRIWHHEHLFEEINGQTKITDRIQYRVLGGKLVDNLMVWRDVQRIFEFRRSRMEELFVVQKAEAGGLTTGSVS